MIYDTSIEGGLAREDSRLSCIAMQWRSVDRWWLWCLAYTLGMRICWCCMASQLCCYIIQLLDGGLKGGTRVVIGNVKVMALPVV